VQKVAAPTAQQLAAMRSPVFNYGPAAATASTSVGSIPQSMEDINDFQRQLLSRLPPQQFVWMTDPNTGTKVPCIPLSMLPQYNSTLAANATTPSSAPPPPPTGAQLYRTMVPSADSVHNGHLSKPSARSTAPSTLQTKQRSVDSSETATQTTTKKTTSVPVAIVDLED
jgi:hypothetical protein